MVGVVSTAARNSTIFAKIGKLAWLAARASSSSKSRPEAIFSAIAPNPALPNCRHKKQSVAD
jgi:hypothetical protein